MTSPVMIVASGEDPDRNRAFPSPPGGGDAGARGGLEYIIHPPEPVAVLKIQVNRRLPVAQRAVEVAEGIERLAVNGVVADRVEPAQGTNPHGRAKRLGTDMLGGLRIPLPERLPGVVVEGIGDRPAG